jgi:hypothetical protein
MSANKQKGYCAQSSQRTDCHVLGRRSEAHQLNYKKTYSEEMFQITVSVTLRDVKMGLLALVKWPVFDYQFCLARYVK